MKQNSMVMIRCVLAGLLGVLFQKSSAQSFYQVITNDIIVTGTVEKSADMKWRLNFDEVLKGKRITDTMQKKSLIICAGLSEIKEGAKIMAFLSYNFYYNCYRPFKGEGVIVPGDDTKREVWKAYVKELIAISGGSKNSRYKKGGSVLVRYISNPVVSSDAARELGRDAAIYSKQLSSTDKKILNDFTLSLPPESELLVSLFPLLTKDDQQAALTRLLMTVKPEDVTISAGFSKVLSEYGHMLTQEARVYIASVILQINDASNLIFILGPYLQNHDKALLFEKMLPWISGDYTTLSERVISFIAEHSGSKRMQELSRQYPLSGDKQKVVDEFKSEAIEYIQKHK